VDPTASLTQLITALESKAISSRELLTLYLDRIQKLDGPINSVITVDADRAMAEADAIDQARVADATSSSNLGPLAGVPITIKDALAVQGMRSTGGARELSDFVPTEDAAAVSVMRDAGALVFGKTNVPRWSGDYQTYNDMFGTTSNPWDLERTPGGSSGGPAAAVAMGFTGFEIGTDIGGSIRLPSAYCGVYGHKPSFGIIPTYGYLDSVRFHRNTADVNVFGPIARSIDDLDLLMGLLAGPNADDQPGWQLALPSSRASSLADFRVAAWLDDHFCPVDPQVLAVMQQAVAALEAAGARVDHVARPDLDPLSASIDGSNLIGAATDISDSDQRESEDQAMSHRVWDVMHRERGELRQKWASFFQDFDVLLCPVAPVAAFKHVQSDLGSNWAHSAIAEHNNLPYRHLLRWNTLTGSAYLPATVPPIGRTANGLPVGMQVVAPYLHDKTALAFARRLTEVVGGYQAPPAAV